MRFINNERESTNLVTEGADEASTWRSALVVSSSDSLESESTGKLKAAPLSVASFLEALTSDSAVSRNFLAGSLRSDD